MDLGAALRDGGVGHAESFELFTQSLDPAWIEAALQATGTASVRRRKLPAESVVWLVIGMALLRDRSIAEVVRHLDLVLPGVDPPQPRPRRAFEYCQEHAFGTKISPVEFAAGGASQGVNPLVQPFGFDPVPGGGSFRGEFFIMTPEPLGVLAGDARGFDIGPNPARSRAFFDINFAAGTGAFQINPTCSAGGGGCVAPLPIGQGNSLDISVTGSTVNIVGNLTQAKTPAPLLTPSITFDFQVSPTGFSGSRNAGFPSFEATRTVGGQTRFIVRSPEGSSFFAPLCLTGICGNEQF